MYGALINPRPATGDPRTDFDRIAVRLYRPDKADEAIARLHDELGDGRRWRPRVIRMPNPRQTCFMGELLEVHCAEVDGRGLPTGQLRIVKWSRGRGPAMLWSPTLSAVIAFPGAPIEPPVHELGAADSICADVYRTWTAGRRDPFGKGKMVQPDPPMELYGPAVCTMYASDKFEHRGHVPVRPFLHHHDRGVDLWVSKPLAAAGRSRPITAIMVRGGDLRVTEDGLAG